MTMPHNMAVSGDNGDSIYGDFVTQKGQQPGQL